MNEETKIWTSENDGVGDPAIEALKHLTVPEKKTMTVFVQMKETSQTIEHEYVTNTYTKGPFYCIRIFDQVVKYPIANIWRVTEN